MNQVNPIWLHLVTVASILIFKITLLIIGYLIAKLGYKLLVDGITGNFKITFKFKGFETNLISGLPGLFFIFLAVLLMGYAVMKDKPFGTQIGKSERPALSNYTGGKASLGIQKPQISNTLEAEGGN
ncbi:MAG: hypothetical protein P8X65_11280 [Syntrophobacterales bacterium]